MYSRLYFVLEVLRWHGFDLIKYYMDVTPGEFRSQVPLTNNSEMIEERSSCFDGSNFVFQFLRMSPTHDNDKGVNEMKPFKIYDSTIDGKYESHAFIVITTDESIYIINTYGGEMQMKIMKHYFADDLVSHEVNVDVVHTDALIDNDFKKVFGFNPIVPQVDVTITMVEHDLKLPNKKEILSDLVNVITKTSFEVDRIELAKIYRNILNM
jgi:hypothetical protein